MNRARLVIGALVLVVAAAYLQRVTDVSALRAVAGVVLADPPGLLLALGCYAAAFGLRTEVWCRVLPGLSRGQSWAALHVSLLGNHLLPLRLGEVLRVTSVLRRTALDAAPVTSSTVTLRGADLVAVLGLAAVVAPAAVLAAAPGWAWLLAAGGLVAVCAAGAAWTLRLRRRGAAVRLPGPLALAAVVAAWALEAAVVYEIARVAGFGLGVAGAVAVTAVALAPAAVVYVDADGEYFPEDMAELVAPVLAGDADYVVGSRFAGDIERMLARRRLGNRVLTAVCGGWLGSPTSPTGRAATAPSPPLPPRRRRSCTTTTTPRCSRSTCSAKGSAAPKYPSATASAAPARRS